MSSDLIAQITSEEELLTGPNPDFAGFSCPFEELDDSLTEFVAAEYARQTIELFAEQFGPTVLQQGSGIKSLFSLLQQADLCFDLAWSSEVGCLHLSSLSQDESLARRSAAAFSLLAGGNGAPGEWELKLDRPTSFLWDNWLLPSCDWLSVASDGGRAEITCAHDSKLSRVCFTLNPDQWEWQCDTPDQVRRLPQLVAGEHHITLIPKQVAVDYSFLDAHKSALESFSPPVLESLKQALEMLEVNIAPYHSWVMRVIRRLAIVHARQNSLNSGNVEKHYGTVYISDNLQPLAIAEMLIHESSHQYHELVCRLGRTVDPARNDLYYSPVKQCQRPLDRILLAYHAFANVMLYYRAAINSGLDEGGYLVNFQGSLVADLQQLEQPLRDTDALTILGRSLVEPLMQRGVC